ncbi:hypothetical protein [Bifidobacterium gallicum]|nr:hypothetical protein [Bifidobacterium gallicum]
MGHLISIDMIGLLTLTISSIMLSVAHILACEEAHSKHLERHI